MMNLIFYGASDDLLEMEGDIQDEFEAYNGTTVKLTATDGEMLVTAHYGGHAPVWSIGVAPADEDRPIPAWPMQYRLAENGYSTALIIQCPDDVTVEKIHE